MQLKEDLAKAIDVGYFRRRGSLRAWMVAAYVLPAIGVLAWLAVRERGRDLRSFSSGPLAAAHAPFGDRCESCHAAASDWRPCNWR